MSETKDYGIRLWKPAKRKASCPVCGKQTLNVTEQAQDSRMFGTCASSCRACGAITSLSVKYPEEDA